MKKRKAMNIGKSLEDSALLIKRVTKIIENKTKEQRDGFNGTLLDTLYGNLLVNMSQGEKVITAGDRSANVISN